MNTLEHNQAKVTDWLRSRSWAMQAAFGTDAEQVEKATKSYNADELELLAVCLETKMRMLGAFLAFHQGNEEMLNVSCLSAIEDETASQFYALRTVLLDRLRAAEEKGGFQAREGERKAG